MRSFPTGFIKRVSRGHVGHVLLAVSWTFILLVLVRRPLTHPRFVDCVSAGEEFFTIAEVNIMYPIWTSIIGCSHAPAILLTHLAMLALQSTVVLSCSETAKLELVLIFVFSAIQWLFVGYGIEWLIKPRRLK